MGKSTCTVALYMDEHRIIIHFKSDKITYEIYPDSGILKVKTENIAWSNRKGVKFTCAMDRQLVRSTLDRLVADINQDSYSDTKLDTSTMMKLIRSRVVMSDSLWKRISPKLRTAFTLVLRFGFSLLLGHEVGGLIGWN